MLALFRLGREVLFVEVEDLLLHLEAKVLIEHHRGVVGRDVQSDVLSSARL